MYCIRIPAHNSNVVDGWDNIPCNAGWLALGRASILFLLGLAHSFGDREITTDWFGQFLVLTARVFYDEAEN